MRRWAPAVAVALALGGCGSDGSDKAATVAKTPTPKVRLTIGAPVDAATVRTASVPVRGTVVPPGAAVTVAGKRAQVTNGAFAATVALTPGANAIDVSAAVAGADPASSTVSVTRGKTATQLAAAARARRKRAAVARRERKAAAARERRRREAARAKANAPVSVPDETGERLDVAEDELRSHGLRYSEVGGGTFGIVVPSNWTVCETRPGPGAQIEKHGRVKLIVGRDC